MASGFCTSGSEAKAVALKPIGSLMVAATSAADFGGELNFSVPEL
jgi:hypothetical protein